MFNNTQSVDVSSVDSVGIERFIGKQIIYKEDYLLSWKDSQKLQKTISGTIQSCYISKTNCNDILLRFVIIFDNGFVRVLGPGDFKILLEKKEE